LSRIPNPESGIQSLCAIVDAEAAARAGWTPIDLARAFLAGGARFLQLRAKQLAGRSFLDTAAAIVELARASGAIVIVNDRADIARLAGAAGVHVGQEDLAPRLVRPIVGDDAVVGLSTHTVEQLDRAFDEPIDYVAIGPVFGTVTKQTGYEAIGIARVTDASRRASARGIPLVAIGGITLDRAAAVIDAGATAIAVIGDLLATGDPEGRTRDFLSRTHHH
jgi:thiamine-phosphate pyrophosphorylase